MDARPFVLGFLVVAGVFVVFSGLDSAGGHTVWDCTFENASVCVQTELEERRGCFDEDRGIHLASACEMTEAGVEDVTMFTDYHNFVTAPLTDEEYEMSSLDVGQNHAWDAAFLDDGRFLYTEMDGELVLHNGTDELARAHVEGAEKFGNTGLLGVAADPAFEENGYVYLYYYTGNVTWNLSVDLNHNFDQPVHNRVSRFVLENGSLSDETVLIDDIPGSDGQSGGRIGIGPDGLLYVTTGDAELAKPEVDRVAERIRDREFLGGKVLRTTLEGEVPAANPYNDSYVYASGFRNPQGLDFHPETGIPYTSMHGPWRHDEINRVVAGGDYGWPARRCDHPHPGLGLEANGTIDPVVCFDAWTLAPSGMAFVDEPGHPWYGDLFVTGLRGSMVFRIGLEDGVVDEREVFYIRRTEAIDNRLRNIEFHNGSLYLFGDGYGVGVITPG